MWLDRQSNQIIEPKEERFKVAVTENAITRPKKKILIIRSAFLWRIVQRTTTFQRVKISSILSNSKEQCSKFWGKLVFPCFPPIVRIAVSLFPCFPLIFKTAVSLFPCFPGKQFPCFPPCFPPFFSQIIFNFLDFFTFRTYILPKSC